MTTQKNGRSDERDHIEISLLGALIERDLIRQDMTMCDLATLCFAPINLIESIIAGDIYKDQIKDDLLEDIATALDDSANTYRIILGREPKYVTEEEKAEIVSSAEHLLTELWTPRKPTNKHDEKIDHVWASED